MKALDYYQNLPDVMSNSELESEFKDVLDYPCSDAREYLDALFELSDRQWHTYSILESTSLRRRISAALLSSWDNRDLDKAESVLGITARLGLQDIFDTLRSRDQSDFAPNVRQAIEGAIQEFGDSVGDPYSGMNK